MGRGRACARAPRCVQQRSWVPPQTGMEEPAWRAPCRWVHPALCHDLPTSSSPPRARQVLLRALRDFNLGKLTSDDTSIFIGLLNDLFPKTLELVPRARELGFEAKVRRAAAEGGGQGVQGCGTSRVPGSQCGPCV